MIHVTYAGKLDFHEQAPRAEDTVWGDSRAEFALVFLDSWRPDDDDYLSRAHLRRVFRKLQRKDLAKGLSVSGEDKFYFARGRAKWLSGCLDELRFSSKSVMDFGCGTGASLPILRALEGVDSVLGVDVSPRSLEVARQQSGSERTRICSLDEYQPSAEIDLAFCNGVFHHVPLAERAGAVNYVMRSLRPGGVFSFWENNPWNPGTRLVMSRTSFDKDAITLSPPQARRLLQEGGFTVLRTDYLFIFPRMLRRLRGLEPALARWPLGAQYQVLARKP